MKKYNLIVAGGGLSGVAAAVSAARAGLEVLLVEKSGCLGGAMSNCLVYPFMPYWTEMDGKKEYLSAGIFEEMRKRQNEYETSKSDMNFKPEYFKLVLDDMVNEAKIDVLYHAVIFGVNTDERQIKSVNIALKSGPLPAEADFFVDATGDGDLFAFAGCDYQTGRDNDGLCQPMTTCFRMSGVDVEMYKKERSALQELYKNYRKEGKIENPREDILTFLGIGEGIVHFNTTRIVKLDPTNPFDVSKAESMARKQIHEIVKFLKDNSKAFANSSIISVASDIGVRESRKLKGVHILTAEELKDCTKFEDSIALGNYDIDIHNPSGSGTSHYYFKDGEFYTIPYRSLLPKEFDNMLVAGRCISATHEAQASVRIMPICCCMGEAAGTAIGVAYNSGTNLHNVDVNEVQTILVSNGAKL